LDEPLEQILAHARLRALLLPAQSNASGTPAVRTSLATHAQTVATLLAAACSSPPLLTGVSLAALTDFLLKSTFGDPRSPLRSDGWTEVSRLYEFGFRGLLASLCEQDLEFFFSQAMQEPDRHKFWLQYLSELERTGCVLDRTPQRRLYAKLQERPELHGAIDRAHAFVGASDVQAFYLVFRTIVVIEFSRKGNAAYVYTREYFEKQLEQRIRRGVVDDEAELKVQQDAKYRILHHKGSWQNDAAVWLASEGVHARARRR
jgi:hypothetical protein